MEYILIAGIFGLGLYLVDRFVCQNKPVDVPIIVVLDIDGSLTTIPGEYNNSAFNIPISTLTNSTDNVYLFGDENKKQKIKAFLQVLAALKKNKLIDIVINSNNYDKRIAYLLEDLGIDMNSFINKKLSKMSKLYEVPTMTKGACLVGVQNAYPKSKIIFFEDDKIYLPQIPIDVVWINCDHGSGSLPYLIDVSLPNINEQSVYNWLKELKN